MKTRILAAAIILGILFPFGHNFTFVIRHAVMAMLFFTFLEIRIHFEVLRKSHVYVALLIPLLGIFFFQIANYWSKEIALAALVIVISPTAAAAPVISTFVRAKAEYVTMAVVLNSACASILIPALLPWLLGDSIHINSWPVLAAVSTTIGLPFVSAMLVRRFFSAMHGKLLHLSPISYILFLTNVYIGMSKASYFIQYETQASLLDIFGIGLSALGICLLGFIIGFFLDNKEYAVEASMALGRKNTMFAIWLALTFMDPLAALGPMFYIIWQNIFNSIQIKRVEKGLNANFFHKMV